MLNRRLRHLVRMLPGRLPAEVFLGTSYWKETQDRLDTVSLLDWELIGIRLKSRTKWLGREKSGSFFFRQIFKLDAFFIWSCFCRDPRLI